MAPEEIRISKEELSVPWALLLHNFCKLSLKERRAEYNNRFENMWLREKEKRQRKKKRQQKSKGRPEKKV